MMKKICYLTVAMIGILSTSCSNDEPQASLPGANKAISYTATANSSSRAASAYESGLDISKITVSAWMTQNNSICPNYAETNKGDATYFLNDVLTRGNGQNSGSFDYATDARYWPSNGEVLDFFAIVDNEAFGDNGKFRFNAKDAKPGLGIISQLQLDKMPDMLYATTFNKTLAKPEVFQQNVAFDFKHAFAKVIVTAEVRNQNLHVVITDMAVKGVISQGQFIFPHKEDKKSEGFNDPVIVDAKWLINESDSYIGVTCLQNANIELDKADVAKQTLVGAPKGTDGKNNDLLMIPNSYDGRNSSGKYQTYIELKGYAYNISNPESGWSDTNDVLIYGDKNEDGSITPATMIIPIEFNWRMGTVNRYNLVFDCGNGGSTDDDPNHPAFVRIGYEVEVTEWAPGEELIEKADSDDSIEYPTNKK